MELNSAVGLHLMDVEVTLRLGIAAVVGLLLGLDREIHGHAAGLRTHGIVCVAAAIMTVSIISLYFQIDGPRMDVLRIFEATGTFVGFIGAGLIVFSRGKLHNLTTAAHLWLTAVIGVACGAGQWPLVLIGTLVSLVMLTLMHFAEVRLERKRTIGQRDDDAPDDRA